MLMYQGNNTFIKQPTSKEERGNRGLLFSYSVYRFFFSLSNENPILTSVSTWRTTAAVELTDEVNHFQPFRDPTSNHWSLTAWYVPLHPLPCWREPLSCAHTLETPQIGLSSSRMVRAPQTSPGTQDVRWTLSRYSQTGGSGLNRALSNLHV